MPPPSLAAASTSGPSLNLVYRKFFGGYCNCSYHDCRAENTLKLGDVIQYHECGKIQVSLFYLTRIHT
uniref:Uncharacterized protein n=1 Tax=Zea mays TaxID=4577 RepID=A0A804QE42_MAIZE